MYIWIGDLKLEKNKQYNGGLTLIQEKQQIDEIIANSQVAFMNGKYYEAYNQA